MALTGRPALLVALSAVLALADPWALAAGCALAALIIAADVALAASPAALQLQREATGPVRLGEPVTLRLLVANPGRRPARGRLRDGWVPSAGARRRELELRVDAGQRRWLELTLQPSRRGVRRSAEVTVRCLGPAGFAGRQRRRPLPAAVLVLPAFPSRRLLPAKLERLRQAEGRLAVRGAGAGSEFDSLRGYADGDDARAVDARASARLGTVVVRTYRPERDRTVLLVLDTGRTAAGRIGDAPRLDALLDAASLLAAVATRAGDRVELLAHDSRLRGVVAAGAAPSGQSPMGRLSAAMALLEPALVETDWPAVTAQILRVAPRRALVVLLTELAPGVVEDSLLALLPRLVRRHRVLFAALRDPALGAMSRGRADVAQVYGAAAAHRSLEARARLASALQGLGVEVLDAEPDRYASRLTDAYLAAKAQGRL